MDSFTTEDRPVTYTKGITFRSMFQSMASTKTLGELAGLGEYGFFYMKKQLCSLLVLD
jgi:uncharacterized cupin superfamily protein